MYNSTPRLVDQLGAVNMAGLTNSQAQQNFNLANAAQGNQLASALGGLAGGNLNTGGSTSSDAGSLGNAGGNLVG
jgi:hypothetical protein